MRGSSKQQEGNVANPDLHPIRSQRLREGCHGGAGAAQDPALNRYKGQDWPAGMGQVYGLSDAYRDAALSMRMDERIHTEGNEAFIALRREIATARLGQPQAAGG